MKTETNFIRYDNEIFKVEMELTGMTWSTLRLIGKGGIRKGRLLLEIQVSHRALKSSKGLGLYAQLAFLCQGSLYTKMLLSTYRFKESVSYDYIDRHRYFLACWIQDKLKFITHHGEFDLSNIHELRSRSADYMLVVLDYIAQYVFLYNDFQFVSEEEWNKYLDE